MTMLETLAPLMAETRAIVLAEQELTPDALARIAARHIRTVVERFKDTYDVTIAGESDPVVYVSRTGEFDWYYKVTAIGNRLKAQFFERGGNKVERTSARVTIYSLQQALEGTAARLAGKINRDW